MAAAAPDAIAAALASSTAARSTSIAGPAFGPSAWQTKGRCDAAPSRAPSASTRAPQTMNKTVASPSPASPAGPKAVKNRSVSCPDAKPAPMTVPTNAPATAHGPGPRPRPRRRLGSAPHPGCPPRSAKSRPPSACSNLSRRNPGSCPAAMRRRSRVMPNRGGAADHAWARAPAAGASWGHSDRTTCSGEYSPADTSVSECTLGNSRFAASRTLQPCSARARTRPCSSSK